MTPNFSELGFQRVAAWGSLVPLRFLQRLETLVLSGNEASDLTPLRDIPSLRALNLMGNPVTDPGPLGDCDRLENLELDKSAACDWTVLAPLFCLTGLLHQLRDRMRSRG